MDHAEFEDIKIFTELKFLKIPEINLTISSDHSDSIFCQSFLIIAPVKNENALESEIFLRGR